MNKTMHRQELNQTKFNYEYHQNELREKVWPNSPFRALRVFRGYSPFPDFGIPGLISSARWENLAAGKAANILLCLLQLCRSFS